MGKVNLANFASYGRLHLTSIDLNHFIALWKMEESVAGGHGGPFQGDYCVNLLQCTFC